MLLKLLFEWGSSSPRSCWTDNGCHEIHRCKNSSSAALQPTTSTANFQSDWGAAWNPACEKYCLCWYSPSKHHDQRNDFSCFSFEFSQNFHFQTFFDLFSPKLEEWVKTVQYFVFGLHEQQLTACILNKVILFGLNLCVWLTSSLTVSSWFQVGLRHEASMNRISYWLHLDLSIAGIPLSCRTVSRMWQDTDGP